MARVESVSGWAGLPRSSRCPFASRCCSNWHFVLSCPRLAVTFYADADRDRKVGNFWVVEVAEVWREGKTLQITTHFRTYRLTATSETLAEKFETSLITLRGFLPTLIESTEWKPSAKAKACARCDRKFSSWNKIYKHHCRYCGEVVCDDCGPVRTSIALSATSSGIRCCFECFGLICPMVDDAHPDHRAAPKSPEPVNKVEWAPDNSATACTLCHKKFKTFFRRHHCRLCGALACGNCCPVRSTPGLTDDPLGVRCCSECAFQHRPDARVTPSRGNRQSVLIRVIGLPFAYARLYICTLQAGVVWGVLDLQGGRGG